MRRYASLLVPALLLTFSATGCDKAGEGSAPPEPSPPDGIDGGGDDPMEDPGAMGEPAPEGGEPPMDGEGIDGGGDDPMEGPGQ